MENGFMSNQAQGASSAPQTLQEFLKKTGSRRVRDHQNKKDALQHDLLHLISFVVGPEHYAVELACLQEILKIPRIARIPKTPPHMLGVINLRGNIVAVVDLKHKLNMGKTDFGEECRIMVVQYGKRHVGLVVDRVVDVVHLPRSAVEPPPPVVGGMGREYLMGVGKIEGQLLILPYLEKLIGSL